MARGQSSAASSSGSSSACKLNSLFSQGTPGLWLSKVVVQGQPFLSSAGLLYLNCGVCVTDRWLPGPDLLIPFFCYRCYSLIRLLSFQFQLSHCFPKILSSTPLQTSIPREPRKSQKEDWLIFQELCTFMVGEEIQNLELIWQHQFWPHSGHWKPYPVTCLYIRKGAKGPSVFMGKSNVITLSKKIIVTSTWGSAIRVANFLISQMSLKTRHYWWILLFLSRIKDKNK